VHADLEHALWVAMQTLKYYAADDWGTEGARARSAISSIMMWRELAHRSAECAPKRKRSAAARRTKR
jgi:hypothetical protein